MLFSFLDFLLPRDDSTNENFTVRTPFWDFHDTKPNAIWEGTYNKIIKQGEKKII